MQLQFTFKISIIIIVILGELPRRHIKFTLRRRTLKEISFLHFVT